MRHSRRLVSYLAVLMYPMLFRVWTVKLLSLTLYVNWEFVTESKSVAVTTTWNTQYLFRKIAVLHIAAQTEINRYYNIIYPFSALTLLVGRQEGHLACKKNWVLVCWWWHSDWSFARLVAPVVTTTSVILSSNKIQNGDILVPANPVSPGKWPLKRWERVPQKKSNYMELFLITWRITVPVVPMKSHPLLVNLHAVFSSVYT